MRAPAPTPFAGATRTASICRWSTPRSPRSREWRRVCAIDSSPPRSSGRSARARVDSRPMRYNLLGRTGLYVSELCLGAHDVRRQGLLGGHRQARARRRSRALVGTALDAGVNFIDTADVYSEGESEKLVGGALKALGRPREQVVVATKVRGRVGPGREPGRPLARPHPREHRREPARASASTTSTSTRSTASIRRRPSRRRCARSTTSCARARRATSASATCPRGSR